MGEKDFHIQQYSTSTTMKDIAALANVSIGTVDRALNNRGRINAKTKQAVLEAAASLNYVRNDFAKALQASRKKHILAMVPLYPTYNDHFVKGLKEENTILANYGLTLDIVRPDTLDRDNFLKAAASIPMDQYEGVVVNAGNPVIASYIDTISAKGISVATLAADSPTSKRLFYSGENPFRAGRLCGELCAKLLNGNGKINFFSGQEYVLSLTERTRGFMDIMCQEYPNIEIGDTISNNDDLSIVREKAEELLFGRPMPDMIFCNSATGALPICEALERYNVKNPPLVVGYDDDERLLEMIKKGLCTAMLYQNPRKQARTALHHLFFYLYNGAEIPTERDTIIDPQIIMKGNVNICL